MKRNILFIICVLSLQCTLANDTVKKNTVSFMTYNIRNAKGLDNITDYQRIADIFVREAVDIVAVQEIDSVTGRSKGVDVLNELSERALMHAVYGASINYDGGKYGIGILSKERPLRHYSVALPGREEERQLLIVEFEQFIVGCTHLSLTGEDRMLSIPLIRKEAARANKPFILLGDFNDLPESDFVKELEKDFSLLNDVKKFTFPANMPRKCIDYIAYYDKGEKSVEDRPFTVLSNKVLDEKTASDHQPVMAQLRFKANQTDIFRSLPYLQNPVDNGITVMWQTNVPAYSWVEYGTDTVNMKKTHLLQDGQVICNNTNHKIRLTDLTPGQRYYYRVLSREMTLYQAYYKEFGVTATSAVYSFILPSSKQTDFTAFIFNDLHKNQDTYDALLKQVKNLSPDMVFYNGDCINDPEDEEQALEHLSLYCAKIDASQRPVFFLRGNHEIRNAYSIGLRDLFDYVGDKTYGAFNWGDTRFVMYDCGEDKPDDTPVYYGLNDFTQLRQDQRKFFTDETSCEAFKNASKRILMGHIPVYGNDDRYNPSHEQWSDILAKAPFNISISGHTHRQAYHPKGTMNNNPFPQIIGGGPEIERAVVMVLSKKGSVMSIQVFNTKGEIVKEELL